MNKKRRIISAIMLIAGLCYLLYVGQETEEVAENVQTEQSEVQETEILESDDTIGCSDEEPEETTASENVMQLKYPSKEQYDIMIEMIKNGDFSCLDIRDSYVEDYVHISDYTEWVTCDIDKDGFDELILQDKEPAGESKEYRIVAAFTYRPKGMHCVEIDVIDGTEYYFLGESGNLIYSCNDYMVDCYGNYGQYILNEEGDKEQVSGLYTTYIVDEDKHYYDMAVAPGWEKEDLTREEFLVAFEEMAGFSFADACYDLGDEIVDKEVEIIDKEVEINEIKKALQAYEEFIAGERCIGDIDIISIATPTREPERRYATDYIVLDVNGDGIPELNIDSGWEFVVISYRDAELYFLQSYIPDPLEREILEEGTLVSYNYKHGDAWCFYQLDREGNEINELYFSREIHQRKENGRYIDEYTYEFDGKPCTEEEWYAKTREYLYTDENGWEQVLNAVEWTRYCEAK